MSDKTTVKSGGVGIFGLMFLLFLGLKLSEVGVVAAWSWWWVTAPIWMPLALLAILFIAFVAFHQK